MSIDFEFDRAVRLMAFKWLDSQKAIHGDVLPREILERGFVFNGSNVPIVGPQGIFKPRIIKSIPLSITTIPGGPLTMISGMVHPSFITDTGEKTPIIMKM
ncbi:hypothetical protein [Solilutibacter silvestris]|uniref:hypothetical protein n=1 Tax=Solilutibacter silvestris TaxID=1645665 RepID=UPI000CA02730|nr:hypothetical protein [Lysobacter silvestris]